MGEIFNVHLSAVSLLFFFALPFAYYSYSAQLWYEPDRIKFFDFLLGFLAALASLFVLGVIVNSIRYGAFENLLMTFVHLGPPILAILAIVRGKNLGLPAVIRGMAPQKEPENEKKKPAAVNAEDVEQVGWDDLIISDEVKNELMSVIELLKDPETAKRFGIKIPKGILFAGPPGTGKTTIARAVANTAGLNFFAFRPDEIISKWVGESEKNLTEFFNAAIEQAPAVVFIDEIDAIGKKRSDKAASHSDALLNHLLQLIDGVIKTDGIYVIGATNRPELVDEALKRAGRLNRVIQIPNPDIESRKKLFELYTRKLNLANNIDLGLLAKATDGNSGADIKEICNQAGLSAWRRITEDGKVKVDGDACIVGHQDFESALEAFSVEEREEDFDDRKADVGPVPVDTKIDKVTWEDLIIDDQLKEELQSVVELLKDPGAAKKYGIDVPKGILLNGPPGTGKTTLAKCVATTAGLSFFVLRADEIVSKWVGDSEKNLTRLFKAAQKHAPSIIFIDEIDSIAKNRSEGNASHEDKLLNHLLQLIDGVIKTAGLYIIAATNRADLVDPALKRGGRLNRVIEVPLPNQDGRICLFDMYLSKLPLAGRIDVVALAKATEGKSGADIKSICNQAGLNAFRRETSKGNRDYQVTAQDLNSALKQFTS